MPEFEYQKPLIDIWLKAFPHTTLLMNFDEPEALAYGTQHGTGWRLDCWGDMRTKHHDPEMLDQYPRRSRAHGNCRMFGKASGVTGGMSARLLHGNGPATT